MSTIDDKYLGDRVKALEEKVTRYAVPNAVQTINDDIFCCYQPYSDNPQVGEGYGEIEVYNKSFKLSLGNYLWLKKSAFNINDTNPAETEFYSKFILNILNINKNYNVCLEDVTYSSNYPGYMVLTFPSSYYDKAILTLALQ